jgi:hypothetical protein
MHRRTFLRKAASAALFGGSAIMAGSIPAAAQRYDRRIQIVNNSGWTIQTVNSTNVGRSDWGRDLLGSSVIRPGRSMIINVEDRSGYCRYDFRAVFSNGRHITRSGVNVCEVARWVIG